jgi:flagellar biosynthetic protein FlhB
MADQDRTESATPKKREEARKRGQVAKSTELSSSLVFLGVVFVLHMTLSSSSKYLMEYMRYGLGVPHVTPLDIPEVYHIATRFMTLLFQVVGPLFIGAIIIGVIVNMTQTGFMFSMQALTPDFNKLNPLKGVQRFLSARGLVETLKAMLKLFLIGYIAWSSIYQNYPAMLSIIRMDIPTLLSFIGNLVYQIALKVGLYLFILAAADYAWQRYSFEKSIRMTKEEVKQELKQSEGNPQIRARIRAKMRQIARRRMMESVPKADVVITNPTHFAVALEYKAESMKAPIVSAKGADLIARRIREIAEENHVPIVQNPTLARTIWKTVDIGQEIPSDLYAAVAEVLAYVYRINKRFQRR